VIWRKIGMGALGVMAAASVATAAEGAQAGESQVFVSFAYIIAAVSFILALKWLSHPRTARQGVLIGEIGMLLAIIGTLVSYQVINYTWIFIAFFIGAAIGVPLAVFMPMTAVPQRTALSHAFGALAAALVGSAHFLLNKPNIDLFEMIALILEMLLGFLTFTGSMMAFSKLQGILPSKPITFKHQNLANFFILGLALASGVALIIAPEMTWLFPIFIVLALTFGVLLIIPIGGADMPTVIALLNAYAGLSASLMGFVLENKLLIIAGALDGSSGLILSIIMCKAMNRSFTNVLFGAFGALSEGAAADDLYGGKVKSGTAEDVAMMLDGAQRVVVAPGYGMAVSQAQFVVRDLASLLESRGATVEYAIHPVAGRMPGHMNVLLAEANIPYDKLKDMDEINPTFAQTDVAIVIGANDTVNPTARIDDPRCPIAGMPILDVDKARAVVVIKRSLSPGFAGIPNPLFAADNTLMLFGDGKKMLLEIIAALKKGA
jgi:NAD(P) transhydrogenase subunit beta